jgi:O-antigen/teichoic acid export membrane protein
LGKATILQRYALAVLAPASVSAAHFVIQLLMLGSLSPAEFGSFAFLLIIVQFGFGLSNALVSTPYMVNVAHGDPSDTAHRTFFTVNALFAVLFGISVTLAGLAIATGPWCYVFGAFGGLAMIRWFGRAYSYAHLKPRAAAISDIVYASFLIATAVSCLCLGLGFLRAQLYNLRIGSLPAYRKVWLGQARWTLLGVVTTESTANVHSYLVTLLAGPAAFAPMSAGALLVRPVLLSMSSLSQLEAPVLARAIASGDFLAADRTCRTFHAILLGIWAMTGLLAGAILLFIPSLIIKPNYAAADIITALALFMIITLAQIWQVPNASALQAANEFKDLSTVSVVSCAFSIAGVLGCLLVFPPVYSLAGIALGQCVMAGLTARLTGRWRHARQEVLT